PIVSPPQLIPSPTSHTAAASLRRIVLLLCLRLGACSTGAIIRNSPGIAASRTAIGSAVGCYATHNALHLRYVARFQIVLRSEGFRRGARCRARCSSVRGNFVDTLLEIISKTRTAA